MSRLFAMIFHEGLGSNTDGAASTHIKSISNAASPVCAISPAATSRTTLLFLHVKAMVIFQGGLLLIL